MFRLLLILIFVLLWLYSLARSATQPLRSFIFNFHFCTLKVHLNIPVGLKMILLTFNSIELNLKIWCNPPFSPLWKFLFCFYFWLLMTLSNGIPLRKSPGALMGWVDPRNLTPGFLLYQSKPHPPWYCFSFSFSILHDIVFFTTLHDIVLFFTTLHDIGNGEGKVGEALSCDEFSEWGFLMKRESHLVLIFHKLCPTPPKNVFF